MSAGWATPFNVSPMRSRDAGASRDQPAANLDRMDGPVAIRRSLERRLRFRKRPKLPWLLLRATNLHGRLAFIRRATWCLRLECTRRSLRGVKGIAARFLFWG